MHNSGAGKLDGDPRLSTSPPGSHFEAKGSSMPSEAGMQGGASDSWNSLEQADSYTEKLQALDDLEVFLDPRDERIARRFEEVSRRAEPRLRKAIELVQFRLHRKKVSSEVISSSPTLEDYSEVFGTKVVHKELTDPSPARRLSCLARIEREQTFQVASVVSNCMIREQDPKVLARMAEVLGKLGNEFQFGALKRASRHKDPGVRLGAILGLTYQSGFERDRVLFERLGDDAREVRKSALEALRLAPLERVLKVYEAIPESRGAKMLAGAIGVLELHLPSPKVRGILSQAMHSSDERLASEALMALARKGDSIVLERIQQLSSSPDERIQKVRQLALQTFREGDPG